MDFEPRQASKEHAQNGSRPRRRPVAGPFHCLTARDSALCASEEKAGDFPFSGATGKGIRVAVIDSGVNSRHPHISSVAGGVSVTPACAVEPQDYTDLLGHGTAVMAAIQEKAPDADYYAVRVFHTALRTSAASLLCALDWCVEQKMDVVNLSLGTPNPIHAEKFREAADEAARKGTLLVAAREADGQPCYPGCLPYVFGVGLDWDCPRHQFGYLVNGDAIVLRASGYPRPAPGVPVRRNLHGISFAVANMSGFIARACEAASHNSQINRHLLIREMLAREAGKYGRSGVSSRLI